ncbi:hypothetical protein [Methanococcus maripaludis]|uniref:hypothetical protein n=1 Tax=Methanococcus maripaludis TaxID=39152 RepID=UPI000AAB26CB|nr:hypothetical protein [Methanococcus maripaludis]
MDELANNLINALFRDLIDITLDLFYLIIALLILIILAFKMKYFLKNLVFRKK